MWNSIKSMLIWLSIPFLAVGGAILALLSLIALVFVMLIPWMLKLGVLVFAVWIALKLFGVL